MEKQLRITMARIKAIEAVAALDAMMELLPPDPAPLGVLGPVHVLRARVDEFRIFLFDKSALADA